MTEQEENELICEKLLGWRVIRPDDDAPLWCVPPTKVFTRPTPSFSNWADAGLIIDALNARLNAVELSIAQWPDGQKRAGVHLLPYVQDTSKPLIQLHGLVISGPLAIRAAALKWIEVNCK